MSLDFVLSCFLLASGRPTVNLDHVEHSLFVFIDLLNSVCSTHFFAGKLLVGFILYSRQ